MDYQDYSHIYDDEYRDYTDDVQFYVRWARRCNPPALELGCGTGRILLALAQAGCPCWGLDLCAPMLDKARQKVAEMPSEVARRVHLVEGDMRDFELDQEFGLIYLPFREFMHLHNEDDQLNCLDAIHRHLSPNGRLIINLYDIDLVALIQRQESNVPLIRQHGGDYTDPSNGHKVYLSSATNYLHRTQMMKEERFYDRVDQQGRVVERRMVTISQRWFFRWEMHHLLHRANFRVHELYGGYDRQPVGEMGGEMIFIARPATEKELLSEVEWLQNKLARVRGARKR
jgi:SAM-dependent methyltransferase